MGYLPIRLLQLAGVSLFAAGQLWPGGIGAPSSLAPFGHIIMYAVMVPLVWPDVVRLRLRHPEMAILVVGLAVGIVMELAQYKIPGRSPEAADVVADFGGLVMGLGFTSASQKFVLWWDARRAARQASEESDVSQDQGTGDKAVDVEAAKSPAGDEGRNQEPDVGAQEYPAGHEADREPEPRVSDDVEGGPRDAVRTSS